VPTRNEITPQEESEEDCMNRKFDVSRLLSLSLLLVLVGALALPASAQSARVNVPSQKSFEQTVNALKSAVSQGGSTLALQDLVRRHK
jgi:hypothetical protein